MFYRSLNVDAEKYYSWIITFSLQRSLWLFFYFKSTCFSNIITLLFFRYAVICGTLDWGGVDLNVHYSYSIIPIHLHKFFMFFCISVIIVMCYLSNAFWSYGTYITVCYMINFLPYSNFIYIFIVWTFYAFIVCFWRLLCILL